MFVKVCGLTSEEHVDWAVKLGYSAIGVVLHPQSVRYCNVEQARKLARYAKGKIKSVAVGLTFAEVEAVYNDFDLVQLYEDKRIPRMIYAGERQPDDHTYKYFIYDVSVGSGEFYELPSWLIWVRESLIISGGLDVKNVKSIIEEYKPFGVDVSSGVEETRGIKDYGLMEKFINEVHNANAGK